MIVSLNEIESLALKAARGAGFAWGLAEEVGWAARWLAANDFDAVVALEALLLGPAAGPAKLDLAIVQGSRLSDLGLNGLPMTLPGATRPIWLAPFVAAVAEDAARPLAVRWGEGRIVLTPEPHSGVRVLCFGDPFARVAGPIEIVRVEPDTTTQGHLPRPGERRVDAVGWERLTRLGARTYVPASQHSREAGAGAGTSDND